LATNPAVCASGWTVVQLLSGLGRRSLRHHMTAEGSASGFATPPDERVVCPLSPEDLSILALENETVVGHTCKIIVLDGRIEVDELRALIASRTQLAPEWSLRLEEIGGAPCWSSAGPVDLNAHVVKREATGPLDDEALRAAVSDLFEQRLDRSRPLWRMDVIPELAEGRSALVWRIHHALADGATAMRLADEVLWDERFEAGSTTVRKPAARLSAGRAHRRGTAAVPALVRESPRLLQRSPFDGHIGARRAVAFASASFLGLHRAATACDGATVNDAVLAVVAGGLRRWLEAGHGHLGTVRVKVPVSLHGLPAGPGEEHHQPGNRDSFFCFDLPLGSIEPMQRLEMIRRATRSRKDGHDAERLDALMRELGRASPRLRQFAERALAHPRSFALNVSNVRGPDRPVSVLGLAVQSFHSLAEIRERHALRIAVVSLADTLSFGLCSDPTLITDVDKLAEHMQLEAAALADCAAG
jgi:diacylglycerol O-acyltransferase